jgi:prolipoprotein diacylglyceryl transferase
VNLAAIPSPTTAVWQLDLFGFTLPIRAYALCIVAGIVAASVVTELRMRRRGAPPWAVLDIAVWAVPFGIIGARIYHVITSPEAYFGANGNLVDALKIWQGGLGIWGAVAGGAVGAWLACRQLRLPLTFVADALAPGLPLAQAIGRLGNWFNNELYGGRTELPWGLKIYQIDSGTGKAETDVEGNPIALPGFYHPTFLYELIWNLGVALLVYLVDRRVKLGRGRAFALYVMAYTVGRTWIEAMRTDEAVQWGGIRLNVFVSVIVFLGALAYFLRVRGPQEFLLPVEGGGYRVVTEAEWAAGAPATGGDAEATVGSSDGATGGDGEAAESKAGGRDGPDGGAEDPDGKSDPDGNSADPGDEPAAGEPGAGSDQPGEKDPVKAGEPAEDGPEEKPAPVEARSRDDG